MASGHCTLQQLCPDDKKKVAKLLKQVVEYGREVSALRDEQTQSEGKHKEQIRIIMQANEEAAKQNLVLKEKISQMLVLLRAYQDKIQRQEIALKERETREPSFSPNISPRPRMTVELHSTISDPVTATKELQMHLSAVASTTTAILNGADKPLPEVHNKVTVSTQTLPGSLDTKRWKQVPDAFPEDNFSQQALVPDQVIPSPLVPPGRSMVQSTASHWSAELANHPDNTIVPHSHTCASCGNEVLAVPAGSLSASASPPESRAVSRVPTPAAENHRLPHSPPSVAQRVVQSHPNYHFKPLPQRTSPAVHSSGARHITVNPYLEDEQPVPVEEVVPATEEYAVASPMVLHPDKQRTSVVSNLLNWQVNQGLATPSIKRKTASKVLKFDPSIGAHGAFFISDTRRETSAADAQGLPDNASVSSSNASSELASSEASHGLAGPAAATAAVLPLQPSQRMNTHSLASTSKPSYTLATYTRTLSMPSASPDHRPNIHQNSGQKSGVVVSPTAEAAGVNLLSRLEAEKPAAKSASTREQAEDTFDDSLVQLLQEVEDMDGLMLSLRHPRSTNNGSPETLSAGSHVGRVRARVNWADDVQLVSTARQQENLQNRRFEGIYEENDVWTQIILQEEH